MTTSAPAGPATRVPASAAPPLLHRLYLGRFVFAAAWAALFVAASSPFGTAALVLAVLYPLADLAAVEIDARSAAGAGRPVAALHLNAVLSGLAALALLLAGTGDVGDVLAIWGAWAVAAGAVQLGVGLRRRGRAGQYPMILSGAGSVVAGTFFAASSAEATSVVPVAGYALVGGVLFLVSALRLRRATRASS